MLEMIFCHIFQLLGKSSGSISRIGFSAFIGTGLIRNMSMPLKKASVCASAEEKHVSATIRVRGNECSSSYLRILRVEDKPSITGIAISGTP